MKTEIVPSIQLIEYIHVLFSIWISIVLVRLVLNKAKAHVHTTNNNNTHTHANVGGFHSTGIRFCLGVHSFDITF